MASVAPSKAVELPPHAQPEPAKPTEANPAAQAAARRIAEYEAVQRAQLQPGKVEIQLDPDAQRFVATLTDSTTSEMLRRYPSESQLAYSRAVMAYLRAQLAK